MQGIEGASQSQKTSNITFAFHSRSKDFNTTGFHSRLHIEPGWEVWHILIAIADGESVGSRVKRDVGDGVSPISIVLNMDLCLGPIVRDDLDSQLSRTGIRAVNHKLPCLTNLGTL